MFTTSLLLTLALAAEPRAAAAGEPFIPACEITSINDQSVPGPDAGVLQSLNVSEGTRVTKGMEIGRVDDTEAQAQLQVRTYEHDVAQQKAKSDIDIRHARAATDVAAAVIRQYREANKKSPGTVSAVDMLRYELEHKKASLATEQTMEEQVEAQLTSKAKGAEVGASKVALDRRILRAPFDGVVVTVFKKPGEWVAPGDPVVHLVGIDRLRVKGDLDANQWGPADIEGRNVTIEVTLPLGRTVQVPGKVTYVSPVVTLGQLPVWAEFEAPMENGRPVVRAGLKASMKIHVDQPVAAAAPPTTAAPTPVRRTSAPAPRN